MTGAIEADMSRPGRRYFLADFFAATFFAGAFAFAAAFAGAFTGVGFVAVLAADLAVAFAGTDDSFALSAVFAGAPFRCPNRRPRSGAAANNSRHSSSVNVFGWRSFGIFAFF